MFFCVETKNTFWANKAHDFKQTWLSIKREIRLFVLFLLKQIEKCLRPFRLVEKSAFPLSELYMYIDLLNAENNDEKYIWNGSTTKKRNDTRREEEEKEENTHKCSSDLLSRITSNDVHQESEQRCRSYVFSYVDWDCLIGKNANDTRHIRRAFLNSKER